MNKPFAFLCLLLALAVPAHAARVALIIGNASYQDRPLKNPVNDAQDLAAALNAAGFKVTLKENLSADGMKEAISEFGDALRRENDTGLFYFSGHGVQTAKGNYLLPVGRAFKREKDVELFAVEARAVLGEMQQARNPLNILILDACRDSPLPASEKSAGSKGLARMDAPSGSVIAFATAPGKTASDNTSGRNGLYTKHLIAAINTPGLRLEDVFKRVGAAVEKESGQNGGDQSPEEVMKLRSEQPFYFKPGTGVQLASLRVESGLPNAAQIESQAWAAAQRANTAAGYAAYLTEYPSGSYAAAARVARAGLEPVARLPEPVQPVRVAAPSAGQSFKDCADCPDMVVIPAGSFGREDGNTVTLASFAMAQTETTTAQYMACVAQQACKPPEWAEPASKYNLQTGSDGHYRGFNADSQPVVGVSWDNARDYAAWLSRKTGQRYQLPTEAQWEYAARAGTRTDWSHGSSEAELKNYAWYNANSGGKSHAVKTLAPNPWNLHDMHGNVWEWVQDCYVEGYRGVAVDGRAAGQDTDGSCYRVLRGGSWYVIPADLRSANRSRNSPDNRSGSSGLRLARTLFTP